MLIISRVFCVFFNVFLACIMVLILNVFFTCDFIFVLHVFLCEFSMCTFNCLFFGLSVFVQSVVVYINISILMPESNQVIVLLFVFMIDISNILNAAIVIFFVSKYLHWVAFAFV